MAKKPVVLVFHVEVVLDDGRLKPGVTVNTMAEQIDAAVWGVVVPNTETPATRKRCLKTEGHEHSVKENNPEREEIPCPKCINYGYNERTPSNV